MSDLVSEVQAGLAAAIAPQRISPSVSEERHQPADDDDRLTFAAIESGVFRAIYAWLKDHTSDIANLFAMLVMRRAELSAVPLQLLRTMRDSLDEAIKKKEAA